MSSFYTSNVQKICFKKNFSVLIPCFQPVYFGCVGIPKECTVHDICSMIKRFFRELKTPLFAHLETKLIDVIFNGFKVVKGCITF